MQLKFNNRDPVYVQVVRYFKEQMASGMLASGQEIPSRRELANKLKINPNTAQRAYKEMEEAGLIFTEGNLPSKITKDEHKINAIRNELLMDAVDTFVHSIRPINVSIDELVQLVTDKYRKEIGE